MDLSCVSASEHLALSYKSAADRIDPAGQGGIPGRAALVVLALSCLLFSDIIRRRASDLTPVQAAGSQVRACQNRIVRRTQNPCAGDLGTLDRCAC